MTIDGDDDLEGLRRAGRAVAEARDGMLTVVAPGVEDPGDDTVLWEGLVLAIEPFLSTGATHAVDGGDGWTLRTADGSLAAQFEHTVVITHGQPLVLTAPG
jgi:methionine aminopeptidase